MSDAIAASPAPLSPPTPTDAASGASAALDTRRALQLLLAVIWVIDGVLQFQPFMFTKDFSAMLAGTAQGNPAVIADPITWAARIVENGPVWTNAAFASIQLLLGLGIAWRPTVKAALAGSIVWSVAVWWFGEGLGGVLDGGANPISGAPGAVILYGLAAVLLWPSRDADPDARPTAPPAAWRQPCVAARAVGANAARILWLVLWGSLAYFAVAPWTGQGGVHDAIAGMEGTNPAWLNALLRAGASAAAGRGDLISVLLAVLLGLIAVAVFLPAPLVRAGVLLGEAFGSLFGGQGTDVNSGPLLILIAAAYWPARPHPTAAAAEPSTEGH
jgi:hypothetical protein